MCTIHNLALAFWRFCLGAPKMFESLRCYNSPADKSNKIQRKFDSVQRATFERNLRVLISGPSRDQTCHPINKTGVGLRRSPDQFQAAYVDSIFQSSVFVEKLTSHNTTEDILFLKAIEESRKRKSLIPQLETTC